MDIKKLADNLGLDPEDYNELLELYIQTTSADIEELRTALSSNDAESAHDRAHSIKGASGNLGLNDLFVLAKEIDDRACNNSLEGLNDRLNDFNIKFERLITEFEESRG